MRKLTENQKAALAAVRENPGLNTHRLAMALGRRQAYERTLVGRLFGLAEQGLIRYEEERGGRHNDVRARSWYPVNGDE